MNSYRFQPAASRLVNLSLAVACSAAFFLFAIDSVKASSGLISSYVNVTTNGSDAWYGLVDPGASTADFEGFDFGEIDLSTGSLSLTGGQVSTFKNSGSDVFSANVSYRVYPSGAPAPSFSNLNLSFNSDSPVTDAGGNNFEGFGDQKWETLTTVNLLSGLTENGEYTIELFASISSSDGDAFHSNFGNNFSSTFTAIPEPSAFLFGTLVCIGCGIRRTFAR